jgi:hypothetical protein
MSDIDPRQTNIDQLLRRTLAAPVPRLSPNFDRALLRKLHRRTQPPSRFSRVLLTSYGVVSGAVCALLMHGQGLGYLPIAVTTLGSLATLELVRRWQWRTSSHKQVS